MLVSSLTKMKYIRIIVAEEKTFEKPIKIVEIESPGVEVYHRVPDEENLETYEENLWAKTEIVKEV